MNKHTIPAKAIKNIVLFIAVFVLISFLHAGAQEPTITINNNPESIRTRIAHTLDSLKDIEVAYPGVTITAFEEMLLESFKIHYKYGMARAFLGQGLNYIDMDEGRESIPYFQNTINMCVGENYDSGELVIKAYLDLGVAYLTCLQYDSATYFEYKGLEEMNKRHMENSTYASLAYTNLGRIWYEEEEYDKAAYYIHIGETLAFNNKRRDVNNDMALLCALEMEGRVYFRKKDYEKARQYDVALQQVATKYDKPEFVRSALLNIGEGLSAQERPGPAIKYYTQALAIKPNPTSPNRFDQYMLLSIAYFQLGDYPNAEKNMRIYLQQTERYNIRSYWGVAYSNLAAIVASEGKFKDAFDYQLIAERIKDSIEHVQKIKEADAIEVRYRTAEQNKEIADKKLKIMAQKSSLIYKNIWLGCIAGGAVLLIAVLISFYIYKQRLHAVRIHNLENEEKIKALESVMQGEENERTRIARDLHDGIGGLLASMKMHYSILRKQYQTTDSEPYFKEVQDIIDVAATELRQTAHNMLPDFLYNYGFCEATRLFCQNAQTRELRIRFESIGELTFTNKATELTLYRIVQELVQNVVKHAKATHAIVQVSCHEGLLNILVEDNGIGASNNDTKGVGLASIKTRMETMGGTMVLQTQSNVGTSVYLELINKY